MGFYKVKHSTVNSAYIQYISPIDVDTEAHKYSFVINFNNGNALKVSYDTYEEATKDKENLNISIGAL